MFKIIFIKSQIELKNRMKQCIPLFKFGKINEQLKEKEEEKKNKKTCFTSKIQFFILAVKKCRKFF